MRTKLSGNKEETLKFAVSLDITEKFLISVAYFYVN